MEQVVMTKSMVLVGKVYRRNYTSMRLKKWTKEVWENLMGKIPIIITMSTGWSALIFPQLELVDWVLTCD